MSRCHGLCCARHAQEAAEGRRRGAGLTRAERVSWWGILLVLLFLTAIVFGACPGPAHAQDSQDGAGGYGGEKELADVKPSSSRPTLKLILRPSVGFMPLGGGPFEVTATALLTDPEEVVLCPGWVIFWGDGEKSIEAPERCGVEETVSQDRRTWNKRHQYKQAVQGDVEVVMMDLADYDSLTLRATARLVLR